MSLSFFFPSEEGYVETIVSFCVFSFKITNLFQTTKIVQRLHKIRYISSPVGVRPTSFQSRLNLQVLSSCHNNHGANDFELAP